MNGVIISRSGCSDPKLSPRIGRTERNLIFEKELEHPLQGIKKTYVEKISKSTF
jgi:hypothetical protein